MDKPNTVNPQNWQDKYNQGFRWDQNLDNWSEHKVSFGEWLHGYHQRFGRNNVLTGSAANSEGVPDDTMSNSSDSVGVYLRTEETAPVGTFKILRDRNYASARDAFVKDNYLFCLSSYGGIGIHGLENIKDFRAYSIEGLQSIEVEDGELILKDDQNNELRLIGKPEEFDVVKNLLS